MVITLISLALGTFVSEDLACVSAGWLIQRGQVDAPAAILACTLGIFSGDVGLWGIGRVFGRAALAWPLIMRVPQRTRLAAIGRWLEHHAALAIVSSRFLPGTRLPLYVMAGFSRVSATTFATWALVGAVLWTPVLVLFTAGIGDALAVHASPVAGHAWISRLLGVTAVLGVLQVVKKSEGIRQVFTYGDRGPERPALHL